VCPYGAPSYDADEGASYKCDGCINRQLLNRLPVCQSNCPAANITLGEFDSLLGSFAGATSIKDTNEVMPNYAAKLDPDITVEVFTDLDNAPGIVDRGSARTTG
jgi:Fe-S-cluster-containing dehydrogenase component